MRFILGFTFLALLATTCNAQDKFTPFGARKAELTKRYSKHLSGDRYSAAYDVSTKLTNETISNADQVVFRLEPGEKFDVAIKFRGHKEQMIRITPLQHNAHMIRNNYEATKKPHGKENEYGSYDYSTEYGPFDSARVFIVEGFSKDCYIGKKCGQRSWYREPVVTDKLKEREGGVFWYDDSREPPTERNMTVTIKIKK